MPTRPNLLLFMTDQQRADTVGAMGSEPAQTPNLDLLAARGTRFYNAYSQHSACSQSRISILTGWYPHVAGHRTLDNLLKPWEPNLLRTLKSAGYYIAWPGVRGDVFAAGLTAEFTDFFGFVVRPKLEAVAEAHRSVFPEGHRLRHAHFRGRLPDDLGPDFDEAAVLTAVSLITDGLPEPFVLVLTLLAPHPPFAVADPWYSLHDRADMPPPVGIGKGKPRFMEELRGRAALGLLGPEDWAELKATYYGMVSRLDDQFGRVCAALERAGCADRTVTCTFSDHGEYMGDYGLVEKWPSGLDTCLVRNPLVVAGPGVAGGQVHEGLVEMVDLLPTLCELADVEVGHRHFGRSLVPVLQGDTTAHRDTAFSEGGFRLDEEAQNEMRAEHPYDVKTSLLHEDPTLVSRAVSLRTATWTYVYRGREPEELYDRIRDPSETANVASEAVNASVVSELRERVLAWMVETSDVVPIERDPRMEPALIEQFL